MLDIALSLGFRPCLKALLALGLCPIAGASAVVLYRLVRIYIHGYKSHLHFLPGPPSRGWIHGSFNPDPEADNLQEIDDWAEAYGPSYRLQLFFNTCGLFTVDTKALQYMLNNPTKFSRPEALRNTLGAAAGDGLIVVEGDKHRQQRRVMNPAFGPAQIRELTSIMSQKSLELRDFWQEQIATNAKSEELEIDVLEAMDKATLDVIGMAGFGYSFDALRTTEDHPNELREALKTVFSVEEESLLLYLQAIAPIFRIIPTRSQRKRAKALEVVTRIGNELIAERKAAVLANAEKSSETNAPTVGKKDIVGRDLLSLLIKANMASDLPESARMADDDVLAQIPTFLMAGHETTSASICWTLHALACNPDIQAKLRAELLSQPTDTPTMDEVNALPYLDAVVREALRVYPPAPSTPREASEDCAIPLEVPFVGRDGVARSEIRMNKGELVFMPIRRMNMREDIWGDDAGEFKPERWLNGVPEAARIIPSVFSNLFTFYAGAHACIGYRFAVIEMKVVLYTLVRGFGFQLAVPKDDVVPKTHIVMKPSLASNRGRGECLPMIVRLVSPQ